MTILKEEMFFNTLDTRIVVCLIDTHFTLDMEQTVRVEWGYETFYSSFASNSRGIAIMFNNNFEFKVHEQILDKIGNYLVLDISIVGKRITLLTIYGPNEDCQKVYKNISDTISNLSNDVIMVGDFNLVLDPSMDYFNHLYINNPKARQVVIEQMNQIT